MKVSVLMITYNHENFIAQAIDGVLMQQVNFDYELVIGEDCSTDNTRDIVIGYQKRHPDKIRLLLPEKNLGGKKNFIQAYKACQGEYIALLDGDDYWTSPHKLQKQVDFLDSHPECAICFHDATWFYEDGGREPRNYCRADQKGISTLEDLLAEDFIPTCSTMFRKGLFGEFPDWYYTVLMGDWSLHILNAQHGDIGYLNEVMGAYRVHPGGIYSLRNAIEKVQGTIHWYETINAHLNYEYQDTIRSAMIKQWDWWSGALAEQLAENGSVQATISKAVEILDDWPVEFPLSKTEKARILSRVYADLGFISYKARDLSTARYCLVRAIPYDPSWLRNRGVWSIGAEAFLGERFAGWLRRGVRSLRRN